MRLNNECISYVSQTLGAANKEILLDTSSK